MNPIWAAAADEGLAVIHHSGAVGYPGYRDLWQNPFLGRLAGAPLGRHARRGRVHWRRHDGPLSDDSVRHPRVAASAGCRSGAAAWTTRPCTWATSPRTSSIKLSEYMTGGRFFAGIVLHEGEEMVKMVTDLIGDHVLMFGSDYPHSESRFPESVQKVLSWESLTPERKRQAALGQPRRVLWGAWSLCTRPSFPGFARQTPLAVACPLLALAVYRLRAATSPRQSAMVATSRAADPTRITIAIRGDPKFVAGKLSMGTVGGIPGVDEMEDMLNAGLGNVDRGNRIHQQLAEQMPTVENGLWQVFPDGRMETTWKLPGRILARRSAVYERGSPIHRDRRARPGPAHFPQRSLPVG